MRRYIQNMFLADLESDESLLRSVPIFHLSVFKMFSGGHYPLPISARAQGSSLTMVTLPLSRIVTYIPPRS